MVRTARVCGFEPELTPFPLSPASCYRSSTPGQCSQEERGSSPSTTCLQLQLPLGRGRLPFCISPRLTLQKLCSKQACPKDGVSLPHQALTQDASSTPDAEAEHTGTLLCPSSVLFGWKFHARGGKKRSGAATSLLPPPQPVLTQSHRAGRPLW